MQMKERGFTWKKWVQRRSLDSIGLTPTEVGTLEVNVTLGHQLSNHRSDCCLSCSKSTFSPLVFPLKATSYFEVLRATELHFLRTTRGGAPWPLGEAGAALLLPAIPPRQDRSAKFWSAGLRIAETYSLEGTMGTV